MARVNRPRAVPWLVIVPRGRLRALVQSGWCATGCGDVASQVAERHRVGLATVASEPSVWWLHEATAGQAEVRDSGCDARKEDGPQSGYRLLHSQGLGRHLGLP